MFKVLFVIFGATGDLTWRKLMPALYQLSVNYEGVLDLIVLGCGSEDLAKGDPAEGDKLFRQRFLKRYTDSQEKWLHPASWQRFARNLFYALGRSSEPEGMAAIAARIDHIRRNNAELNEVYYFATPPEAYAPSLRHLRQFRVIEPSANESRPWKRAVLEKPLGRDPKQALDNLEEFRRTLPGESRFQMDHWGGKSKIIPGIPIYRFANRISEPVANGDHTQLTHCYAYETVGVEQRGGFTGSVLDMAASHLMLVYGLLRIGQPEDFSTDFIPRLVSSAKELAENPDLILQVQLGRYTEGETPEIDSKKHLSMKRVPGYLQEPGSDPNICTACAVDICPPGQRWQRRTIFRLEAVKRADEKNGGARHWYYLPPHALFDHVPMDGNGFGLRQNNRTLTFEREIYGPLGDGSVVKKRITGDSRTTVAPTPCGRKLRTIVSEHLEELPVTAGDGYSDMLSQILLPPEQLGSNIVPRWLPSEFQYYALVALSRAREKALHDGRMLEYPAGRKPEWNPPPLRDWR